MQQRCVWMGRVEEMAAASPQSRPTPPHASVPPARTFSRRYIQPGPRPRQDSPNFWCPYTRIAEFATAPDLFPTITTPITKNLKSQSALKCLNRLSLLFISTLSKNQYAMHHEVNAGSEGNH